MDDSSLFPFPADDRRLTQLQETGWLPISGLQLSHLLSLVERLGIDPAEVLLHGGRVEVVPK